MSITWTAIGPGLIESLCITTVVCCFKKRFLYDFTNQNLRNVENSVCKILDLVSKLKDNLKNAPGKFHSN